MSNSDEHIERDISNNKLTQYLSWIIILLFIISISALIFFEWDNESFRALLLEQFKVIVLIPVAALFSFVLISLFQTISGKVEFEFFGQKFKGASGPVIMWVLSYAVIIASIHILWVK